MHACATVGGGVMFVPEVIERKGAVSYSSLVKEEKAKKGLRLFGKKIPAKKISKKLKKQAA